MVFQSLLFSLTADDSGCQVGPRAPLCRVPEEPGLRASTATVWSQPGCLQNGTLSHLPLVQPATWATRSREERRSKAHLALGLQVGIQASFKNYTPVFQFQLHFLPPHFPPPPPCFCSLLPSPSSPLPSSSHLLLLLSSFSFLFLSFPFFFSFLSPSHPPSPPSSSSSFSFFSFQHQRRGNLQ